MIFKSSGRLPRSQIPKSQSFIPWPGQGKVSIGWENDVRHEVGVTVQPFDGDTEVALVPGQFPDDKGTIWG